jgi:hypothetical protein
MIEINKNLDGTLEKAIRESSKLQKKTRIPSDRYACW